MVDVSNHTTYGKGDDAFWEIYWYSAPSVGKFQSVFIQTWIKDS